MNTRADKYTSFRSAGIRPAQCGFLCSLLLLSGLGPVRASVPTAPVIIAPTTGESIVVPFTNSWTASTDPDGLVAYAWEVALDPEFTVVIYNNSTFPDETNDIWSGLTDGVYYWHVQAANNALVKGPWSAAQSFTVSGASAAEPVAPTLNPPQGYTTFHPLEAEFWNWTAVQGAATYTFEFNQDPNFTLGGSLTFGSGTNAAFAIENPQGTYYMRVRAVNSNGYRSVPSNVQVVTVSDSNPIPAAPEPVLPANGAVVTFPVFLSWTSVPNPQPGGYTIEVSDSPSFAILGAAGEATSNNVPLLSIGPGTWYWEVYSSVGDVNTAFSAAGNFTISSEPPEVVAVIFDTPDGLLDNGTTNVVNGSFNSFMVQLSTPTSGANTNVELTSSDSNAFPLPATMPMPAATANNEIDVTAGFVSTPTPVTLTATYGGTSKSFTVNVLPPTLASVAGAGGAQALESSEQLTVAVTLTGGAPPGGAVVSLSSSSPLVSVPATVTVPATSSSQTFTATASDVTTNTPATITATYQGVSAQCQIVLGPPVPPASISVCPNRLSNSVPMSASGTVTIAQAVNYPVTLGLTCSDTNLIPFLASQLTIAPGSLSGNFTFQVEFTSATTNITISVSGAGVTLSSTVEINPVDAAPPVPATLTLTPSTVVGGNTSTGTVTLSGPAPAGGAVVSLGAELTSVTVPATVTIPAGSTSATFTITTPQVGSQTALSISAGYNCGFAFAGLTLNPVTTAAQLSVFLLNPITVAGGSSCQGTVLLNGGAPSGGAKVSLSSGSPSVAVPSSVTIAAGASNASFTVTTGSVSTTNNANLTATYLGVVAPAILTVLPGSSGSGPTVSSVSLNPSSVTGGSSSTGTVTLSGAAPSGGAIVSLSSGNTAVAMVPSSVTVAAGATSANFTVTTVLVSSTTSVTISASYNGSTQNATLTVNPSNSGALSSLSLNPTSVTGGNSSTGTVTLSSPAPRRGAVVTLSSGNTSVATVPSSVTVQQGATTANFTIKAVSVSSTTPVTISASFNGSTQNATLTVNPSSSSVSLSSLSLNPGSVTGGSNSTGTVTLSGPAPNGGAVVSLSSGNTSVATVPSSVTVAAGATTANFTVTTVSVSSSTPVTISASYNGGTQNATLTVNPSSSSVSLSSLSLNPSSVTGGSNSTGTVTLSGAAPSGGAVVSLSSGNTSVATVPSSVTVAAGATTANFTVTTVSVSSTTPVTISASYNGTQNATLTVNPSSSSVILSSLSLNPTSVNGGNNSTGTVTLSGAAPSGGANVTLSSSDTSVVTVPNSVTVPAGATSANFTVGTQRVRSNTNVTISGSYGGQNRSATLTVTGSRH